MRLALCHVILAVLNRYFDADLADLISSDSLHARLNDQQFMVASDWGIVARNHILKSWSRFPPNFNGHEHTLSLEAICSAYGREAFNELVKVMLSDVDYFDLWIGTDA